MLRLATYNLCNLGPLSAEARYARLAADIVGPLQAPAVVAVQELAGDAATDADGRVPAVAAPRRLTDAVRAAGGPDYCYLEAAPGPGEDGGQRGLDIRCGLFIDPARVAWSRLGAAGAETGVRHGPCGPSLTCSPGRIGGHSPAFIGCSDHHWLPSRKVLVAQLRWQGRPLFVLVCHLKSMRAETRRAEDYAKRQRHAQALEVQALVRALLACDPQAQVVVLGDFNDGIGSRTLDVLRAAPLHNLMERLPRKQRYTRRHGGRPQTLDHVLVSATLCDAACVEVLHLNTDGPQEARVSDHDPVCVTLGTAESLAAALDAATQSP